MSQRSVTGATIFNTDIGNVVVQDVVVTEFDVEDVIRDRAVSLARKIQFLRAAKTIDINKPTAARTIKSTYLTSSEVLPS